MFERFFAVYKMIITIILPVVKRDGIKNISKNYDVADLSFVSSFVNK